MIGLKPYLLFDFDGTLADSLHLGLAIANELSSQYGYQPLTEEELDYLRGQPLSTIFKRVHIPFYRIPAFLLQGKKRLNERLSELQPISGMPEALHTLKAADFKMALLTSNALDNVLPFLERYNIKVFDWYCCDIGLFQKTAALNREIEKRGLLKKDVFYIGDEARDIRAAKAVKIPMLSVSWGYQPRSLLETYHPEHLLDTPDELVRFFIS